MVDNGQKVPTSIAQSDREQQLQESKEKEAKIDTNKTTEGGAGIDTWLEQKKSPSMMRALIT